MKDRLLKGTANKPMLGAYTDPDLVNSSKDAKLEIGATSTNVLQEKSNNYFDVVFPRSYMKELKEAKANGKTVIVL